MKRLFLALAVSVALPAASALAQDYPTRAVHLIAPAPAGGPTDLVARIVGQKLNEMWKQPVVVENRAGAQSILGTEYVSRAAPDGYTVLVLVDSTVTQLPHRKEKLSYDPKSLTPVMTLIDSPMVLVASSATKAESLADFVKMAKMKPGQMSVGTGTLGTKVVVALFSKLAQIELLGVPYKGATESAQAVVAGQLDMAITAISTIRSNIGTGRINILAITGSARNPVMPTVPTLGELGYPGFERGLWIGLAVPAGTPDTIIQKLHADVSKVMEMPDIQAQINGMGSRVIRNNPSSTAELIRTESERWREIVPAVE